MQRGKLLAVAFLGSLSLACSSGGGGGGGGSGGTQVPATVNYDFSTLAAPLEIEFSDGELDVLLHLSGIYNIGPEDYTIAPGPLIDLDTGPLAGELEVEVVTMVVAQVDELPTAGSLRILQGTSNDVITVTVNNAVPGVDLYYDEGGDGIDIEGPVTYTWDDFADLKDSGTAEEWEEIASYVYSTIEFIYARFFMIVEAFATGFDYEEDIELSPGTYFIVRDCDFYPAHIQQQGTILLLWVDVDANGEIGPGDGWEIEVERCWVDDPTSDIDTWYNGRILIQGLIDQANPFMSGGTVIFENLVQQDTEQNGQGDLIPGTDITLDGEADILFSE